jgi:sarcosine oxidase subunit alpha
VTVGQLSTDLRRIESATRRPCDALGVSGGWSPTLHLYAHAGGKLEYDGLTGALRPVSSHPTIQLVGGAAGFMDPTAAVHHAMQVGEAAALAAMGRGTAASPRAKAEAQNVGLRVSPVGNARRQWVDLLHDVTVADLQLAVRENYTSVEHAKRYTTVGMAADQGKTSTALSIQTLARLRGESPAALGYTAFRPPFVPTTLGAIAGRELGAFFAPRRRLSLHQWHLRHGALMHDFGEWQRPVAYLHEGESRTQAMEREIRLVRSAVGLFDGSPIGKLEVRGPDAGQFLDRFYINDLTTLKAGRARYGLMLLESGVLFDDGTVTLLAPDHFLLTTTSGNVGRVAAWMEEWHQCEWPHLKVAVTPATDHWATIALTGPRSREVLAKLSPDFDLANAVFPHLGMRTGQVLGLPVRVFRVSFSGELTYEINTPASEIDKLWDALLEAGQHFGIAPFGLDALLAMRMEKGFLHIGTDTDGTTVPEDVGWGKVAARKSADFIGKRSLTLPENVRTDRLQLIGLAGTPGLPMHVGSHLRLPGSTRVTDGWVTSAGVSSETGRPIAMGMLHGGRGYIGANVTVHDVTGMTRATVVELPFLDAAGARMQG